MKLISRSIALLASNPIAVRRSWRWMPRRIYLTWPGLWRTEAWKEAFVRRCTMQHLCWMLLSVFSTQSYYSMHWFWEKMLCLWDCNKKSYEFTQLVETDKWAVAAKTQFGSWAAAVMLTRQCLLFSGGLYFSLCIYLCMYLSSHTHVQVCASVSSFRCYFDSFESIEAYILTYSCTGFVCMLCNEMCERPPDPVTSILP